jgi:hypothetical protein
MPVADLDAVGFMEDIEALTKGAVGKIKFSPGLVLGLATLAETNPQAMRERIRARCKTKTQTDPDDNKRVVKLKDAIECVDRALRSPQFLLDAMLKLVGAVVLRIGDEDFLGRGISKPVVVCLRNKVLSQTVKRKYQQRIYMRRQRRGVA